MNSALSRLLFNNLNRHTRRNARISLRCARLSSPRLVYAFLSTPFSIHISLSRFFAIHVCAIAALMCVDAYIVAFSWVAVKRACRAPCFEISSQSGFVTEAEKAFRCEIQDSLCSTASIFLDFLWDFVSARVMSLFSRFFDTIADKVLRMRVDR